MSDYRGKIRSLEQNIKEISQYSMGAFYWLHKV